MKHSKLFILKQFILRWAQEEKKDLNGKWHHLRERERALKLDTPGPVKRRLKQSRFEVRTGNRGESTELYQGKENFRGKSGWCRLKGRSLRRGEGVHKPSQQTQVGVEPQLLSLCSRTSSFSSSEVPFPFLPLQASLDGCHFTCSLSPQTLPLWFYIHLFQHAHLPISRHIPTSPLQENWTGQNHPTHACILFMLLDFLKLFG